MTSERPFYVSRETSDLPIERPELSKEPIVYHNRPIYDLLFGGTGGLYRGWVVSGILEVLEANAPINGA